MLSPFPTQFTNPMPAANDGLLERMAKIEARVLPLEAGEAAEVSSFNSRSGAVTLQLGDVTALPGFSTLSDSRYVLKTGDTMSGGLSINSTLFTTGDVGLGTSVVFPNVRLTVQDTSTNTVVFINNMLSPGGAAGSGGTASFILRSTTSAPYGWRVAADAAIDQFLFQDEGVGTRAWIPAQANSAFGIGAPNPGGSGVLLHTTADGRLMLTNVASTSFERLQFGGVTSSFPALQRTTTVLEVVLADNSARTQLYAATLRTTQTTVAGLPAAATAGAGARAFVTDANTTKTLGDGTTVVGGGANLVPVYSDGTNWIIG